MHIETFQVLADLVDTKSFSEAAKRNGITQSAVSQQIRALEERFGVVLVERGRRNFLVTPEGEVFLQAGEVILEAFRGIQNQLETMRDVVAGKLTVSTVYSIGFHELPPFLDHFRVEFPDVDLEVHYRQSHQVYSDVLENRADLGLVAYPKERKGVKIEPAWKDKLVVICLPDHPLAKRKSLSLPALGGQRFVSFQPDLPTRKAIDEMLLQQDVVVRELVDFDNVETVKRVVMIENAVSIVPSDSVGEEVKAGTLVRIPIKGKFVWRPLGIIRRRTKAISPAMRELIGILKSGRSEATTP